MMTSKNGSAAKRRERRRRTRDDDPRGRGRFDMVPSSLSTLSAGAGFPRKLRVRHKYVERISIPCVTGIGAYLFSCNGMYDPNITGTGHQPMYFDQLAAIYDHYTVFSSHMKAEFVVDAGNVVWSMYMSDDTTLASGSTAGEQAGSKTGILTSKAVRPQVVQLTWDAKKFFGGDVFDNDNLQGNAAANPTEQSYFQLTFTDFAGTSLNVLLNVVIEYDVVWDEVRTIASS